MRNRRSRRWMNSDADPARRLGTGLAILAAVFVVGTAGYLLLGLAPIDAVYQSVTTVSTVGFRELGELTVPWKVFTVLLVVAGVGAVLYNLTVVFEILVEGQLTDHLWRRRMQREIDGMRDHVIVCGAGRLGRTVVRYLASAGEDVVVIDQDADRLAAIPQPQLHGDATDDAVLVLAGVERARCLVAATDTDASNLYITLSARSLRPGLFIVARARLDDAEPKLRQAGADRVVNPQAIGGSRIAAMTLQPNVAEFVDVVMHDGHLEFRLEEVPMRHGSALTGRTIREAHIRDRTGAMVLALRHPDGTFETNPEPDTTIGADDVLIVIGTRDQLAALDAEVQRPRT